MRTFFFILALAVTACGGSDSTPDSSPDGGNGSGSNGGAALACRDFAYCSTYEVNQYNGTIEAPAGGAIADGTYRLAYKVNPASAGESNDTFGDYSSGYRFRNGTYVHSDINGRGVFSISGTTLSLSRVTGCNLGTEGSAGPSTDTYTYTATADRLVFFDDVSSSSNHWTAMRVFLKVDDLCKTVTTTPTTPGDSYRCTVTNCACGESTQGPINACN
ncbi:hypothetical protein BH11MYX1_BH11MYX1_36730 [soil metagenome]